MRIAPIKAKSDVKIEFQKYHVWQERKSDCRLKLLHSENGGEYVALEGIISAQGIEFSRSTRYIHRRRMAPRNELIAQSWTVLVPC